MKLIDLLREDPARPPTPVPIDTVRPRSCANCDAAAGAIPRLLFHGHGVRVTHAVVPPRHWEPGAARIVAVAARRFRCTECGAVVVRLPRGLLPRHVYALFTIVFAWWVAARPGAHDEAVYALLGVDRRRSGPESRHRSGRRRWRSLARWARRIGEWWPGRAVAGSTWRDRVASLLAGFAAEAREADVVGVIERAVAAHVGAGAPM